MRAKENPSFHTRYLGPIDIIVTTKHHIRHVHITSKAKCKNHNIYFSLLHGAHPASRIVVTQVAAWTHDSYSECSLFLPLRCISEENATLRRHSRWPAPWGKAMGVQRESESSHRGYADACPEITEISKLTTMSPSNEGDRPFMGSHRPFHLS